MRSLAATMSPEMMAAREQELEALQSPAKRAAALALHHTALHHPRAVSRLSGLYYEPSDWHVVGQGYHSTVMQATPDEVVKVQNRTLLFNAYRQEQYVQASRQDYVQLRRRLGEFVLPLHISREEHPIIRNKTVVQMRQPYIAEAIDPRLTIGSLGAEALTERLDRMQIEHPHAFAQLPELIDRSWELFRHNELLPDLCGEGNLLIEPRNGNLILVDGQPVKAAGHHSDPQAYENVQQHLTNMQASLELIAI